MISPRIFVPVAIVATLLGSAAIVYAAQTAREPLVGRETGEDSTLQSSVFNAARLKLGFCTATTTGSEAAQTATCNGASGVITSGFNITVVSNNRDVITVTNNKVTVGDACIAMIDDTGANGASLPEITSCRVSANTIVLTVVNPTSTSAAATAKFQFVILTAGNPN